MKTQSVRRAKSRKKKSDFIPMTECVSDLLVDSQGFATEMLMLELEEGSSIIDSLRYVVKRFKPEAFAKRYSLPETEVASVMTDDVAYSTVVKSLKCLNCELQGVRLGDKSTH